MARIRPFEYLPPADYALFVEALRRDRCIEYPLVGWEAIGRWFSQMGFVRTPFKPGTLKKYRKLYGLPVTHQARALNVRRKPWTTNLLLSAWLATQGRVLTLPRWHPFRLAIEPRPASQKPSAMRMRRMRDRRRALDAAAASAIRVGSSVPLPTSVP